MKRLIVNADDLGRTEGINDGIFEAHQGGIVTSATLMVAYPAARTAASRLAAFPNLGVGLHCQLTGGRPLLDPARLPSLVGEDGNFPAKPELHGKLSPDEVAAELEAQAQRFEALVGRLPTHLDSHHHSHRLPVVAEAVTRLARRLGVPVRRTGTTFDVGLAAPGVRSTDHFVETFYGDNTTVAALVGIVDALGVGTTEVMCHPARVDEGLLASSGYATPRAVELTSLCDPAVHARVQERGIALIHFGDL